MQIYFLPETGADGPDARLGDFNERSELDADLSDLELQWGDERDPIAAAIDEAAIDLIEDLGVRP